MAFNPSAYNPSSSPLFSLSSQELATIHSHLESALTLINTPSSTLTHQEVLTIQSHLWAALNIFPGLGSDNYNFLEDLLTLLDSSPNPLQDPSFPGASPLRDIISEVAFHQSKLSSPSAVAEWLAN